MKRPKHDQRDVALIGLDLLVCVVSLVTRLTGHSRVAVIDAARRDILACLSFDRHARWSRAHSK
jgi:hypothetical protein